MAYLEVSAFKKLRAFFWALQKSSFNLNKIPFRDNEGTPVDKAYCLTLLRSFPDFQGEAFKDDNFLIKYLSKPGNLKQILDQFTPAQQIELTKVLEEKPAAVAVRGEQPSSGETLAEQGVPTQTPTDTTTGTMGVPGLPSAASTSYAPRRVIIHNVPHAPESPPPKIAIANKSGVVAETPPSKIYIADKSGAVVREHAIQSTAATEKPKTAKLYVADKSGKVVGERTIPRAPSAFTKVFKNLGSSAQIGIKNFLGRVGRAGGGMLGSLAGGGGRFLGRVGLGGADALASIGTQMSRGSVIKGAPKKVWLGLLLGFFLFTFVVGFISVSPTSQPIAPGTTPPSGGNIASCQFTRGDRTPPQESYKSPILLNYFQQAQQISSVPAQVLAAIARVESPTITSKTDADLPALSSTTGCPRSQTGALGIMQIQPPGTRGYIKDAVEKGASYLGKTAQDLTEADFCDLSSNIIIASGFILKKLQGSYGIGDGNKWDPSWTDNRDVIYKLAEGYYGCLEYGGPDPLKCGGPYNYGDDIWTSIQSCKITQVFDSCPVLDGKITYASYQADPKTGHCTSGSAEDVCPLACPFTSRRSKSIDVDTSGSKNVVLPTINGQVTQWRFIQALCAGSGTYPNCTSSKGGTGGLYTFEGTVTGETDKWYLQFVHMQIPAQLEIDKSYVSGTVVGKTDISIVHITIGENIKNPTGSGSVETDCDPGWIAADSMCKK